MPEKLEKLRLETPVEWLASPGLTAYEEAVAFMRTRAAEIAAGQAPELVWLVEHPPLYTAGTSADPKDLTDPDRFCVHKTGRGGEYTYHGPGQRVAYVMLSVKQRSGDVRLFVRGLERWIINTLEAFHVSGERRAGRVGVWVQRGAHEDKIAALGLRVSRGVSYHGISLNVAPDLSHYEGIVPCGISEHGVTSFADLGLPVTMAAADAALRTAFEDIFGPTVPVTITALPQRT